jgi:hypothetical protein
MFPFVTRFGRWAALALLGLCLSLAAHDAQAWGPRRYGYYGYYRHGPYFYHGPRFYGWGPRYYGYWPGYYYRWGYPYWYPYPYPYPYGFGYSIR